MNQSELEELFSKVKAREYVENLLMSDEGGQEVVAYGTELLEAWVILPSTYTAKEERRETLAKMDIPKIVKRVFTDMLMLSRPMTLANMSTTLGISLGFQEAKQGITLAGEIIAILAHTEFFGITRSNKQSSYYIYPKAVLTDEQYVIADRGMYLPPLIERPQPLKHNRSTPYKTIKGESLILGGQANHHEYNICHDVLNKQNNIPLSLNLDFLNEVEEEATFNLDQIKGMDAMPVIVAKELIRLQKRNWEIHLDQSFNVYETMCDTGNKFYLPNKVDKRGRIYAQGHHINSMGAGFKKASIDLFNKEKVQVPKGFFK